MLDQGFRGRSDATKCLAHSATNRFRGFEPCDVTHCVTRVRETAMRLTLRTLLAYRDGVLSPAETSDLHQRIRQTEVASNLLRRVENLVKNKQLLAPKLIGEGLGADANSVAEYLDDTLASEQVPEFERICIVESDLVLAELAHCHQMLADAMRSQVVVPSDLRSLAISLTNPQNQAALQRRLKIGGKASAAASTAGTLRRLDSAHPEKLVEAVEVTAAEAVSAQRSQVQAPMVASGGGSIKPQGLDLERPQLAHEVPEYLVGQRSGGWRIPLAIGAMIALLSVLAWQALGPLSNVRELLVASNAMPMNPETKNGAPQRSGKPNSEDPNSKEPVSKDTSTEDSKQTSRKPEIETTASSTALPSSPVASEIPSEDVASSGSKAPPASEESKLSDVAIPVPEPKATTSAFRWNPGAEEINSVLFFRKFAKGSTLQRILANAPIPTDGEIVVPPSMRPTLNLAGHCAWTVCGPTLMQLSGNENVTITTSLCRAITKGASLGREVTIAAPSGLVKLQFEDATSTAAIEVAYRAVSYGPITDKLAFKPFLIIVAVEGQISVTPIREAGDSRKIRLVVGEGVAYAEGEPLEFELGAIPSWYRTGNDRPVDSLAAADMNKSINGSDVTAQLTNLCADRRPETAALAIQTKILLGEWSDFASDFLNNEAMRNHWSNAIGLAEQMIAASEPNAEALRSSLEAENVGRGKALYSLLTGNADGLQPKELLLKLGEALGSGELDERVLADYQLRRLTGKDLGFQPSNPNRVVLQQWRRSIATNPIILPFDNPIWEAKKP